MWLSWQRIPLQCGRLGFSPWVGKISWRRERLPTPVFWPGDFHGLYSLRVGHDWATFTSGHFPYSSVGKESEVKVKSQGRAWLFAIPWTVGSSVHGIVQARVLRWVAISSSRGSSPSRDRSWVSHIVGRRFYCLSHQEVKNLLPMQETLVQILGQEDPLEKG